MDPKNNGHKKKAVIPVKKVTDSCPDCGEKLVHQEATLFCPNCGWQKAPC